MTHWVLKSDLLHNVFGPFHSLSFDFNQQWMAGICLILPLSIQPIPEGAQLNRRLSYTAHIGRIGKTEHKKATRITISQPSTLSFMEIVLT